jgi:hypothetical protein
VGETTQVSDASAGRAPAASAGLTSGVIGLCSTAPTTHAAPKSNTSQKSRLQFATISVGGCGFLQIATIPTVAS